MDKITNQDPKDANSISELGSQKSGSINNKLSSLKNSSRRFLIPLVLLVVLILIGVAVTRQDKPQQPAANLDKQEQLFEKYPQGKVVDGITQFQLVVSERQITEGPTDIKVKKGDKVLINITTEKDLEETIVLDGYGVNSTLGRNTVAQLEFTADKVGEFKIISKNIEGYYGEEHAEAENEESENPGYQQPVVMGVVVVFE